MPKRPQEKPSNKAVYKSDQAELDRLIMKNEELAEQLFANPGDDKLRRDLHAVEIKIAALTKQKIITSDLL